jgi:4-amino-4-deoxy-L-arabinose transferase-like glycosyltransferase
MEAVAELRETRIARCEVVAADRGTPRSHAAAIGFLALWTLLNLLYLAFACTHDLAPDEAHYWHWSRHLDWSYYSKGPLVAWLIRVSCGLFGDTMFAVRLPAALCGTAILAGLYVLVSDVLKDRRLALGTMLAAATLPGLTAVSVIMTIDPPFLACWCWSLVLLHRRCWSAAGICTALGILAKYPMLLLPIAMLASISARRVSEGLSGPRLRFGLMKYCFLSVAGCLPILVWNANHDWVSFRHVFEQTNASGPAPLAFLGGQAGFLMVFWFLAFLGGAWRFRRTSDTGLSLMWWTSVPVWGVFLLASFRSPGQANWPAAAYIGGAVLAAAWIRDSWHRRWVRIGLIVAVILGTFASIGLRFPQPFRLLIAAILPTPSESDPSPVRRLDATARLAGWRTLAAEIDRLRDVNPNAILAGMTWTIPGELSFHCTGHPEAYSFGPALADRRSQYDLWRPNPVSDPEALHGRTFLYVGDEIPEFGEVFDRVEEPIRVTHVESGVPLARWTVWVCHGFRGFPPRRTPTGF